MFRTSLRVLRRTALFSSAVSTLLLCQCTPAPEKRTDTVPAAAVEVAKVFETAHPYTARVLDSAKVAGFLAAHPEYRSDSAAVMDFYQNRGMQFAWFVHDSLSGSAETFMEMAGAPDSVAPPGAVAAPDLDVLHEEAEAALAQGVACDSCQVNLELRLTAEFFRFADHKFNGYLSRDVRDLNWFIPRAKKDLSHLLDSIAVGKLDMTSYEPTHPQYQMLKTQIVRYRTLAQEPWPALAPPAGVKKVTLGANSTVVGEIRHRLFLLGDLEGDDSSSHYDKAMLVGVKSFQERHGLDIDGVIGANFFTAISVTPAERLRTMLVNIERLRWAPEQQPANLIMVNIPEFRLHVFDAGQEVLNMKVVVGARATHTVVFSDTLSTVVFSPSWTVPTSITTNEILPAIKKDPGYLRKHDMEIVGGSKTAPIIRQKPGPDNSLGRVKFVFPNSYGIYFHDTPARSLFGADQRALSHGCIRLSHPRELAEFLLHDDASWPPERIASAMTSGKETYVKLKEKRPVLIAYFTAWVDPKGRVNFRQDVYGHDAQLARELFDTAQ